MNLDFSMRYNINNYFNKIKFNWLRPYSSDGECINYALECSIIVMCELLYL